MKSLLSHCSIRVVVVEPSNTEIKLEATLNTDELVLQVDRPSELKLQSNERIETNEMEVSFLVTLCVMNRELKLFQFAQLPGHGPHSHRLRLLQR